MDNLLSAAAARGDKVIPVLANEHDYCDGAAKTLAWYKRGYRHRQPGDIVSYEKYVAAAVTRYADDPTVALWQLVNEGEALQRNGSCNEAAAMGALAGFSDRIGGLVHHLDANHLVSLGAIAGYSGSGHQWCGAADRDYQTLMASAGSDVCDFHDYSFPAKPMGMPFHPNLTSAIQMCHTDGKPIMVAETGIHAMSNGQLPRRAGEFQRKLSAQFQAGVVGELLWCWTVKPAYVKPVADADYGIFPGDPSLDVLSSFISAS
jgi:endo-1,4-beta-mannosidase